MLRSYCWSSLLLLVLLAPAYLFAASVPAVALLDIRFQNIEGARPQVSKSTREVAAKIQDKSGQQVLFAARLNTLLADVSLQQRDICWDSECLLAAGRATGAGRLLAIEVSGSGLATYEIKARLFDLKAQNLVAMVEESFSGELDDLAFHVGFIWDKMIQVLPDSSQLPRLAIIDYRGPDARGAALASRVTAGLWQAAIAAGRYQLVERAQVIDELNFRQKTDKDCRDIACVEQVVNSLGCDLLLQGTIESQNNAGVRTSVLTAELYDRSQGKFQKLASWTLLPGAVPQQEIDTFVALALGVSDGKLQVDGPPGANLSLNGLAVGQLPFYIRSIDAGHYELTVTAPGFVPHKELVTVYHRQLASIRVQLDPLRGALKVESNIAGAQVFVDQQKQGKTPYLDANLPVGEYLLRVNPQHSDFDNFEQVIRVLAFETTTVVADFKVPMGTLVVRGKPDNALVTLYERSVSGPVVWQGRIPSKQELPLGFYRLSAAASGYNSEDLSIEIRENEQLELELALSVVAATVMVESDPAGALVQIDGKGRYFTPCSVPQVPYGPHQLTISAPNKVPQTQELNISSANTLNVSVVLVDTPAYLAAVAAVSKLYNSELAEYRAQTVNYRRVFWGGLVGGSLSAALGYSYMQESDSRYSSYQKSKVRYQNAGEGEDFDALYAATLEKYDSYKAKQLEARTVYAISGALYVAAIISRSRQPPAPQKSTPEALLGRGPDSRVEIMLLADGGIGWQWKRKF